MPYREKETEKVYFSIAEVASMIHQATSAIRFWEKEFNWLRPKKNKSGHRHYNRNDVDTVMKINWMLNGIGMTIEGVKKAHEMCYDNDLVEFVSSKQRNYQGKIT